MVIAMPDRVILKEKLACKRGVGVERHRSGLIKLLVAERPDRGCGRHAVTPIGYSFHLYRRKRRRKLLVTRIIFLTVFGVTFFFCCPQTPKSAKKIRRTRKSIKIFFAHYAFFFALFVFPQAYANATGLCGRLQQLRDRRLSQFP